MKSRKILMPLLLAVMAVAGGCSSSHSDDDDIIVGPVPSARPDYISPACSMPAIKVEFVEGAGVLNIAGAGYDITEPYLSASAVKAPVIDLDKLPEGRYTYISAPFSEIGGEGDTGDTRAFLDKLSKDAGISPGGTSTGHPAYAFGSTVDFYNSPVSASNQWNMRENFMRTHIFTINTVRPEPLIAALSDEFTSALASMSGDEIVARFGTHVVVRAITGVALQFVYGAEIINRDEATAVGQGFDAIFAYMNGDANKPDHLSLALMECMNFGGKLTVRVIGGDRDNVHYDAENIKLTVDNEWTQGANADNCGIIAIEEKNLKMITEYIADDTKRAEVLDAIVRHINGSQPKIVATAPLLQSAAGNIFRYANNSDDIAPKGFKFYGVLGNMYINEEPGSIALYRYTRDDKSQTLSTERTGNDWMRMGYVMRQPADNTITLYEITNGKSVSYTIEDSDSYGPDDNWHKTGKSFYLIKP